MGITLDELIEQGKQIRSTGLFMGCGEFWQWHENCCEFLEQVKLSFREEITSPFHVQKGVEWLQSTFRHNGDNHQ